MIEGVKANIDRRNRNIERHRNDLKGHVRNLASAESERRARAKDERERAESAIEVLELREHGQEEPEEPPGAEPSAGDVSASSATVAPDTSVAIQLASIAVVEQLTHRVEELSPHQYEKDIARATREFLNVLRQYTAGEVPEDAARSALESLRGIRKWCVSHTASATMGALGVQVLELVTGYNVL